MTELFPWAHSIAVMRRQRRLLRETSGAGRLRDKLRRTSNQNRDYGNSKGQLLRKVARKLPQRGRKPFNGLQRKAKATVHGTPEAVGASSRKALAQATFLDCGWGLGVKGLFSSSAAGGGLWPKGVHAHGTHSWHQGALVAKEQSRRAMD